MKITAITLILLIFWLLNFLGLTDFSHTVLLLVLVPGFIQAMSNKKLRKDAMSKPFMVTVVGLILCSVSSYVYEGQSVFQCFNGLAGLLPLFLFYYFLKAYKVQKDTILKALKYAGIIYCIFYLLNYICIIYGFSLIHVSDKALEIGIDARVRIPGSMLIAYLFFSSLSTFILQRKRKELLLCVLALSVILVMAFRTMIAGIALCAILELFYLKGVSKSIFGYVIIGTVVVIVLYNVPIIKQKVDYMVSKQEEKSQTFEDKDYIRWITYEYFTEHFFANNTEKVLGSGPTGYGSAYTKKLVELQESGLYMVDWGLVGESWKYGIITIAGWIWFSLIMITRKWNTKYKYLAILYIYLLIISVTTVEFSRLGNWVIHAAVLYLINFCNLYSCKHTYKE